MIALIVNTSDAPKGPIPYAFEFSGLAAREVRDVEQTDRTARREGFGSCVVVIEEGALSERPDGAVWRSYLRERPDLPVVVTSCGGASDAIRDVVAGRGRILLEDPFDAAAVVAAVRRVLSAPRTRIRRRDRVRETEPPS